MIKYRCPYCGWEGTDFDVAWFAEDEENVDACPICINDYKNKSVDLLYKHWYGEDILKSRDELCTQLEIVEIVL